MPRLRVRPPDVPVAAQWLLRVDGDLVPPSAWTPITAGAHEIELQLAAALPAGCVRGTCRWTVVVGDGADVDVRLPGPLRQTPPTPGGPAL